MQRYVSSCEAEGAALPGFVGCPSIVAGTASLSKNFWTHVFFFHKLFADLGMLGLMLPGRSGIYQEPVQKGHKIFIPTLAGNRVRDLE